MPSNGGGTKLTRTLLAGEAEGVCSGGGVGVRDSTGVGDREGDCSGVAEGVGVLDSCARAAEAKNTVRIAVLTFVVMSSGAETSLIS